MFLKASQTIEHSTGLTLGTRRASHLGNIKKCFFNFVFSLIYKCYLLDTSYSGEEIDNEQEMENYLISVIALHKLMQIEQHLMRDIIAVTHRPRVFELIVREAMDTLVQDGEVIYTH